MALNTTSSQTDPVLAAQDALDANLAELDEKRKDAYRTYVRSIRAAIDANPEETVVSAAAKLGKNRDGLYQLFRRYPITDPTDAQ